MAKERLVIKAKETPDFEVNEASELKVKEAFDLEDKPTPAIEARGLTVRLGDHTVLSDLSFSVGRGKLVSLLGVNGAGKTTLFRTCLNLTRSSAGEVLIEGEDASRLSPRSLARKIAFVPQTQSVAFDFTVFEIIAMGRTPFVHSLRLSAEHRDLVLRAADKVGMSDKLFRKFNQLSGGQKQLVLIARAVAQDTPVILMDEPTSALDFHNQVFIWKLLKSLADEGKTVFISCHDPNMIANFADEVLILSEGKLLAHGSPKTLFSYDLLHTLYGACFSVHDIRETPFILPEDR